MSTSAGAMRSSGCEAAGFYRTRVQPQDDPRPYMQSVLVATLGSEETAKKNFNFQDQASCT